MLDDAARDAQPDHSDPVTGSDNSASEAPFGSLADDVSALLEDGKTYAEAEIAFQKSRAGFAGSQAKNGIIFALGAFAFLHLALIGLVVGLIFALAPYVSGFGATAIVVGALLIGVAVFGKLASNRFKEMGSAFKGGDDEQA